MGAWGRTSAWLGSAAAICALGVAVASPASGQQFDKRIDPGADREVDPLVIDRDPDGARYVSGELIVTYRDDASRSQIAAANEQVDARTTDRFGPIDARAVVLREIEDIGSRDRRQAELETARRELEADPRVEAAEYNFVQRTQAIPNDPQFPQQWGLPRIRAPQAWDTTAGEETLIAVLDSGIQATHPDIGGLVAGADFVNGDNNPEDNNGHGTHVTGIAGALTNNGVGVAGTSPEGEFLIGKVCEDGGGGLGGPAGCPLAAQLAGLIATADFGGVNVINMSLGGPACPTVQRDAVDYATNRGALVVAAAGNDATSIPSCPAAFPNAVAVSATNFDNGDSNFSNFGPWIDIAAPGGSTAPGDPASEDILSTYPVSTYAFLAGTGMSSPYVAGVASLLASQGRGRAEIRNRIESTGTDLPPAGKDVLFGNGLVNAQAAVRSQTNACTLANAGLAGAHQNLATAEQNASDAQGKVKKAKRKAKKAKRKAKKLGTPRAEKKAKKAKKKLKKAKRKASAANEAVAAVEGSVQAAQNQVSAAAAAKGFAC